MKPALICALIAFLTACGGARLHSDPASWKPIEFYRTESTLPRLSLVAAALGEVTGHPFAEVTTGGAERLAYEVFRVPTADNFIQMQISTAKANPMVKGLTPAEESRLRAVLRVIYVERQWSAKGEPIDPLAKPTATPVVETRVPNAPSAPPPVVIDSRPLMGTSVHLRDIEQPSRWILVADGSFTGVYADNQRTAIAWGAVGSALTVDGGATWTKRDWPAGQGPISGLVLEGGSIVLLTEDGELVAPTGFSYSAAMDLPLVKRVDRTDRGLLLAQTKTKVIALKQTSPQVFAVAWSAEAQLYDALGTSCLVKTANGRLSTLSVDGTLSPNAEIMSPSPMLPQGWQPTTAVTQTAPEQKGLLVDATGAQYNGDRWVPLDVQAPCLLLSHGGDVTLALYAGGQPLLQVAGQRHKATDSLLDGTTAVAPLTAVLIAATPSGLVKTPRLAE